MTRILSNKFAHADLDHINRSLSIDVISPINLLCLEQINRLLVWCKEHPEIHTILLNLGANKYGQEQADSIDPDKLEIINQQIQRISLLLSLIHI